MDVRIAIAAFEAVDDGLASVSETCRRLGISRDTFYRYRARLEVDGFPGLLPRSTRPRSSPNQTAGWLVELILQQRAGLLEEGWDHGARSIHARLHRAGVEVPSARTVHRILVREGLIEPAPEQTSTVLVQAVREPRPQRMLATGRDRVGTGRRQPGQHLHRREGPGVTL